MSNTISPFACVMDAIEPGERAPHIANARTLFNGVTDVLEIENGFSFCFGSNAAVLPLLAEFIRLEKLCCPFFGFTVDVKPEGGNIYLALTGREGVKPFIQAEVAEIIGTQIVHLKSA